MPVHAKAKVDSKCFSLTMKADAFLSLGNAGKEPVVPADFWKELSQDPEAVSRYVDHAAAQVGILLICAN